MKYENHFQKVQLIFHIECNFENWILPIFERPKVFEEVLIKKLFEYKLSVFWTGQSWASQLWTPYCTGKKNFNPFSYSLQKIGSAILTQIWNFSSLESKKVLMRRDLFALKKEENCTNLEMPISWTMLIIMQMKQVLNKKDLQYNFE